MCVWWCVCGLLAFDVFINYVKSLPSHPPLFTSSPCLSGVLAYPPRALVSKLSHCLVSPYLLPYLIISYTLYVPDAMVPPCRCQELIFPVPTPPPFFFYVVLILSPGLSFRCRRNGWGEIRKSSNGNHDNSHGVVDCDDGGDWRVLPAKWSAGGDGHDISNVIHESDSNGNGASNPHGKEYT